LFSTRLTVKGGGAASGFFHIALAKMSVVKAGDFAKAAAK
jgi:hypothetical protein